MKTNLIIITLFFCLTSFGLRAELSGSFPSMPSSEFNREFVWQSERFYQDELSFDLSFPTFTDNGLLSMDSKLLLLILDDSEGLTSGDDTSDEDNLYYANDVPLGDGLFPLLFSVIIWILVVFIKNLRSLREKNRLE